MDDPAIEKCVVTFRGECHGIGLYPRGTRGDGDKHICIMGLTEDDGNWFPCDNNMGSSTWLLEWLQIMQAAQAWMQTNADKHIAENGKCYGYKFREC